MALRKQLGRVLTALVIVFLVTMLLGQLLGTPILLSYVETGSMAPTMEPGDGFIAVPTAVAGEIQEGDVIVFEATTLNGGGLTTHRVVGETEQGYITKGDANPTTDQDGNEPPVTEGQIKAKALQIGGSVVVIPNFGVLVTGIQGLLSGFQRTLATTLGTRQLLGTQGLAYLFLGIGILAYAGSVLFGSQTNRPRRRDTDRRTETINVTIIIVALTVVLMLLLTATMVVPGGTQEFSFVSADTGSPDPSVIEAGSTANFTYLVPSTGFVPTIVYLEPQSAGITITPNQMYLQGNTEERAVIQLEAPEQTGTYNRYMAEYRYLAVLPQSTIQTLYEIHPWAPIIAIDVLLGTGFCALSYALVGSGMLRLRSRSRDVGLSWTERIRRWFR